MNYFNRNKILIGLVIFITIVNLASLGTMIYLQSSEDDYDRYEHHEYRDKDYYKDKRRKEYSCDKPVEFRNFMDSVRQNFKREVAPHAREIKVTQSAIMHELMKENPDREKLDSLANKAGRLHYHVKKNMIDVFMKRNRQSDSVEKKHLRRFYRHFMVKPHDRHMKKRRHDRHDHHDDYRKEGRRWKH